MLNSCDVPRITHPAWFAMLREVARLGLPRNFRDDVFRHDRAYLEIARPVAFVWCLRELGSHLVPCRPAGFGNGETAGALANVDSIEKVFGGERRAWFVCHSGILVPTSYLAARSFLARNPLPHPPGEETYREYLRVKTEEDCWARTAAWEAVSTIRRAIGWRYPNWGSDPA